MQVSLQDASLHDKNVKVFKLPPKQTSLPLRDIQFNSSSIAQIRIWLWRTLSLDSPDEKGTETCTLYASDSTMK